MEYNLLKGFLTSHNILFEQNYYTYKLSSFRSGGKAKIIIFPKTLEEFCDILKKAKALNCKFIVLGNGTNVVFNDFGYNGAIISTRFLDYVEIKGSKMKAFCGALLADCTIFAMRKSLSGMESLFGIPASIGGAIFMNSSAYGMEISELVEKCGVYDIENDEMLILDREAMCFGAKRSILSEKRNLILLYAIFNLSYGNLIDIKGKMLELTFKRIKSQPLDLPSCGSAFKRPQNFYASKLIDEGGLKGLKIGGAQISLKHAGFIINVNNAKSKDLLKLLDKTRLKILTKYKVSLEQEIIFVD